MQDQSTFSSGYFWISTENFTLSHFPQIFACYQQTVMAVTNELCKELCKELLHSLMQIFSALIVLWLHIFYSIWYLCCQVFIVYKFYHYLYGWGISSTCVLTHFVQPSTSEVTFCVLQLVKDLRSLATANENYAS